MIAWFCEAIINNYPHMKIVNLVHTKELIEQNYSKFKEIAPRIPSSIYSASIGQKSVSGKVVYAGIQSIWKHPHLARFDIAVIDEAHLISKQQATGMYRQYLDGLMENNPNLVIVGMTGTPYRMDGGSLVEGDERLFDELVCDIGIRELLDQSYLSPLVLPQMQIKTKFDTSSLKTSSNDFNQAALAEIMDDAFLIDQAVDEYMNLSQGRKCHLIFGTSIDHCYSLNKSFSRYIKCEVVHGGVGKKEREKLISSHKNSTLPMLINQGVLTTGYDCPQIDSIGMFRATKSVPLYIQIAGRGLRLSSLKSNCLWVDFTDTTERLGPVDMVEPPQMKIKGEGSAPVKQCWQCEQPVPASLMLCPFCGAEFDINLAPSHGIEASTSSILSEYKHPEWKKITGIYANSHKSRKSGNNTLKIDYECGIKTYSEWMAVDGNKGVSDRFAKFWDKSGGNLPFPESIEEAVNRIKEIKTSSVLIDNNGKYPKVRSFN